MNVDDQHSQTRPRVSGLQEGQVLSHKRKSQEQNDPWNVNAQEESKDEIMSTVASSLDDEETKQQRLKIQKLDEKTQNTKDDEKWRKQAKYFLEELYNGQIKLFNVRGLLEASTHEKLLPVLVDIILSFVFESITRTPLKKGDNPLYHPLSHIINVFKDGDKGFRGFIYNNEGEETTGLFMERELAVDPSDEHKSVIDLLLGRRPNTINVEKQFDPISMRILDHPTGKCFIQSAWLNDYLEVPDETLQARKFMSNEPMIITRVALDYPNNMTTTLEDVDLDGDNQFIRGCIECETRCPEDHKKNTKVKGYFYEADNNGLRDVYLEESTPNDNTMLTRTYKGQGLLISEATKVVHIVKEGEGYEIVNHRYRQMSIFAGFWEQGVLTGRCCIVDALLRRIYLLTLTRTEQQTYYNGELFQLPDCIVSLDTELDVKQANVSSSILANQSFRDIPILGEVYIFDKVPLKELLKKAEYREIISILNPRLSEPDSKAFEDKSMSATRTVIGMAKNAALEFFI